MATNATTTVPTTTPSSLTSTTTLPSSSTELSTTTTSTTTIPSTTTTSTQPSTTSTTTTPSSPPSSSEFSTTIFTTGSNGGSTVITTIFSTETATPTIDPSTDTTSSTSSSGALLTSTSSAGSGLGQPGTIAVAVIVPIAGVAFLVLAGIFLWRKRKQRKDAEEERRKEVEDYIYNPNADPNAPDAGGVAGAGGAFEMKEDASSGYRGWGSTTLAGSSGRKASTTMSGGAAGVAYSDATSPTRANHSDTRSAEGLMDTPHSPEGEILGAMGPSATETRANVHRGPSNASSSYSAAARSDASGEGPIGAAYGGPSGYYDQYSGSNPYTEGAAGQQPVIRDNPARRNTRIENTTHYPQQSAGISQNF